MKKFTLFFILLAASITLLTACQSSGNSGSVVGTYVNRNNTSEYFELHEDNTFYLFEYNTELTGTWSVEDDKLTFDFDGFASMFNATTTVKGNTIHDQEGKTWDKQEG